MLDHMIDVRPFFCRVSIISIAILIYFLRLLKRAISMALLIGPPQPSQQSSWLSQGHQMVKEDEQQSFKLSNENVCESMMGVGQRSSDLIKKGSDVGRISRRRPARLVVPTCFVGIDYVDKAKKVECMNEFKVVEGNDFFLASKKGRREVMEDRHAAVVDILGDPKQAFFVVIDGHGGHAAAEYVAENLGKNIVNELVGVGKAGNQIQAALRGGYSETDKQFLAQDVNGGACAAGVLLKDGELHAANVGDCRVVLSRKGKAITLTNDHRLSREDERSRIENSGGFLHCHNGVWRVNGSLAVSRAFGDLHLKDWIICDPDIVTTPLTPDCEFLIVASDGLWDKVTEQEAVDVVSTKRNSVDSCKKLVEMSSTRGNRDDITVMTINLEKYKIGIP